MVEFKPVNQEEEKKELASILHPATASEEALSQEAPVPAKESPSSAVQMQYQGATDEVQSDSTEKAQNIQSDRIVISPDSNENTD